MLEDGAELRRLRNRLRVLSEATHAFAEATTDYQRLVQTVAQRLAEVIRDTCAVFSLSDDGKSLTPISIHAPTPETIRNINEFLARAPLVLEDHAAAKRVIETGEALLIPRFDPKQLRSQTTDEHIDFETSTGIHSLLVVPLRLHGRSIGMLTLSRFRDDSPPFDDDDRELAQTLANHAALAIANARAYVELQTARDATEKAKNALRNTKSRFDRLEQAGILGIIVTNLDDGHVVEINETLLNIVGYSRAEVFSDDFRWATLTPPEWTELDAWAIGELKRLGIAGLREKQYLRKDGTLVPVMVGSAMLDGTRETISFVLDITERKKKEAELELRAEHAADAKFRDLIETSPEALVLVDAEGRIVIVNGETEKLFGYARDELVGKGVEILNPDRFRSAHHAHRDDYLANHKVRAIGTGLELYGHRKDGTEFPIEITLERPVTGGMLITRIRDITERKRNEEQRFQLAAIVDSSDDAIIGKTLEGIITSWNGGAQRLFGYAANEVIGKSIALLLPTGMEEEEKQILARLKRGEVDHFDTVRRRKDGQDIDVSVTSSPVYDSTGKMIGASKVARDITDRRQAEAALARAKETAEAANSELEAFSYSVAHDLRAPLRGMSGFAQIVLEDYEEKLDAEGKDCLLEICSSAQKMGELIDALLSLSRVTRSDWRPERVNLSALVRAVASQLAKSDPNRKVNVVAQEDLSADADLHLTRALFENLLGNAWKFTANAPDARLEFGATDEGGTRTFFIRDNGAGFDMAYARKLFTPFQRLHTVSEFAGTGIGLATVQRIVNRHGGRIWAEGKVGFGATFYFTLPNVSSRAITS